MTEKEIDDEGKTRRRRLTEDQKKTPAPEDELRRVSEGRMSGKRGGMTAEEKKQEGELERRATAEFVRIYGREAGEMSSGQMNRIIDTLKRQMRHNAEHQVYDIDPDQHPEGSFMRAVHESFAECLLPPGKRKGDIIDSHTKNQFGMMMRYLGRLSRLSPQEQADELFEYYYTHDSSIRPESGCDAYGTWHPKFIKTLIQKIADQNPGVKANMPGG